MASRKYEISLLTEAVKIAYPELSYVVRWSERYDAYIVALGTTGDHPRKLVLFRFIAIDDKPHFTMQEYLPVTPRASA